MSNKPRVFVSASDDHHLDENQLEIKHAILNELEAPPHRCEPWRFFEKGPLRKGWGFHRAILLLEEGCETFSNIHGLGHITFSKGKIASSFDEVRDVLGREGFLDS